MTRVSWAAPVLFLFLSAPGWADVPVPCLERLLSVQEIALKDCARNNGGSLKAENLGTGFDGSVVYLLTDFGGGSGIFTSVMAVQADGGHFRKTLDIEGGDRCSGGIRDARVEGNTLVVEQNITTHMLVQHLAKSIAGDETTPFGRENWPYCATCCAARRETKYEFSGEAKPAGNLTVNLDGLRTQTADSAAATCLLRLMDAPGESFVILQGEQEVQSLATRVQDGCAR